MKKLWTFFLVTYFLHCLVGMSLQQCVDAVADCDYWSDVEECIITAQYMMCSCALSCQTPDLCNLTTSNDTNCLCRSWAASGQCSNPSTRSECPTTCHQRETVQCPDVPDVAHAHAVPNKTKYYFLDIVMYDCSEGYKNNFNPNLVCNEEGKWVIPRYHILPTCKWIVCGTPPTIAHASWEGTTFDFNSTVVYSCDPGYEAKGGSDVRRCDGTKSWAGSDLVCEKVSCGLPPDLQDAAVTFDSTHYEGVATYTCDVGYNASEPSVIKQCSEFRNWTGEDIECSIVVCGNPPNIDHTEVQSTGVSYGSVANYTCVKGYNSVGGDYFRKCSEDGLWAGSDAICEIKACGTPPTLNNTDVAFDNTTYGATAEYSCVKGHNSVGGESVKLCTENGTWLGVDLKCEVISCGPPTDVAYTDWSAELHVYQSQASYSCVSGYRKSGGHDVKTCLDTGVWDGENLQCQVVTCGALPTIPNADSDSMNDTYLSTATYTCKEGYNQTGGDVTKSCDQNGSWEGTDLICSPVDCGPPPEAANASKTYSTTFYQSTAEYTCDKGYNSSQLVWPLTCGPEKQWLGGLPQCEIIDCGAPPSVEHTDVTYGSTVYQSYASYVCVKGYNKVGGSDKKTCADTGAWQGPNLLCQIVSCGAAPEVFKSISVTTGSTYGSTASYSCIKGYKMIGGTSKKSCSELGTWTGKDINCTIVTCGVAPDLSNTRIIGNYSRVYQSKVTYDCNPGYETDGGNETMTCSESGVWNGEQLRCKERPSAAETIGVITKFEPEVVEASGSVGFGVAACVIMSVILTGILLLDLSTFYRHLKYMKENLTDFWESRKPPRSISLPEKNYCSEA